jgi:tetratricopeptide (TPR) repeat protein
MEFCQSGLALAISIGSLNKQAQILATMAWIKTKSGEFSGAKDDASKSQRAAKIVGQLLVEARALRIEAICWRNLGSYSHCIFLLDRAIHLLDLCGMSGGTLQLDIRNSQAEVHRCKSEYVEARNIQNHILRNISVDQNQYYHALVSLNIAQIDVENGGAPHDVQRSLETAGLIFQNLKNSTGIMFCDIIRAALDLQQGNLSAARCLFQKCLQSAWGNDAEAVTYCMEKLGAAQQWGPVKWVSVSRTLTFLAHSVKYKKRLELHKALQFLGDIFEAYRDQETAISLFTVALEGFTRMDVHRSKAECLVRLGAISKLIGDDRKAVKLWDMARPLYKRSSQGKQLAELNSRLAGLGHNELQEV